MRIPENGYKTRRGTDRRQVKSETCSQNASAPVWNALLWITVVLILALILIVLFRHYKLPDLFHVPGGVQSPGIVAQSKKCQLLPPHGSVHVIDPSVMNRTDALYSGVQIDNQHDYPLIALLSDASNSAHYFAISVAPGEAAHVSAPVGHYGMQVFVGSAWCDLETGFSDGAKVIVDDGIVVQASKITALEFYGSGIDPVQLALAYSSAHRPAHQKDKQQPVEVIGAGKIELLQANNGHYFSVGTINDTPVLFLIDTGATYVSVSSKIAERAGIRECFPYHVMTANGGVDACMAIVSVITFGAFQLNDVEVIVLPDMFDEALLGMNILHHFRIEQANQVMRISLQ